MSRPDEEPHAAGWHRAAERIGGVVCLSTADWDAELWTNKQHLMSRLSTAVPVVYVESLGLREPRLSLRDLRRILARLRPGRRPAADVPPAHAAGAPAGARPTVVAPLVVPLHRWRWVRRLNRRLVRRALAAPVAALPRPRVLWAYSPLAIDEVDVDDYDQVLFHCVDDLATVPGVPFAATRDMEARLADRADATFASAPASADRLRPVAGDRVALLPNVADTGLFARALEPGEPPEELAAIPQPRIVFAGALSDHKIDWALLEAVARAAPDLQLVLIGPVGAEQAMDGHRRLADLPNCHLLGPRPHAALPDYLRAATAAIVPYAVNEHTASVFPMKVWEYLATGVPVVSTSLPAMVDLRPPVRFADDPTAFVAALRQAHRDPVEDRRRSAAAAGHSWEANLERMLAGLADAPTRTEARA